MAGSQLCILTTFPQDGYQQEQLQVEDPAQLVQERELMSCKWGKTLVKL